MEKKKKITRILVGVHDLATVQIMKLRGHNFDVVLKGPGACIKNLFFFHFAVISEVVFLSFY
jgi:hypothetical protein